MFRHVTSRRAWLAGAPMMALLVASLSPWDAAAQRRAVRGAVYTMSNAAGGNTILAFDRRADGSLQIGGYFPTGDLGSGGGLGNQGGLVLSPGHRWLFAVNAGSNSISVFEVRPFGLRHLRNVPSGGDTPVSVTTNGRLLYVLNAGSDDIYGFRVGPFGSLEPIPGSRQPLSSTSTAPAQIEFSHRGDLLIVTEKATNKIVTFPLDRDGAAGPGIVQDSPGQTPFGFALGRRDQVFVSEAFGGAPGASTVSSFTLERDGMLTVISPTVATTQTAACWVVVTNDGRFAYVTNTADNTISSFRIEFDGSLALLNAVEVQTGGGPIDMALSPDNRFLYVLNQRSGSIGDYRIDNDGGLSSIPGSTTGLPTSSNGLAAR
jgi:6-phosphogluconolactonase